MLNRGRQADKRGKLRWAKGWKGYIRSLSAGRLTAWSCGCKLRPRGELLLLDRGASARWLFSTCGSGRFPGQKHVDGIQYVARCQVFASLNAAWPSDFWRVLSIVPGAGHWDKPNSYRRSTTEQIRADSRVGLPDSWIWRQIRSSERFTQCAGLGMCALWPDIDPGQPCDFLGM
jgi:hypothetical protein